MNTEDIKDKLWDTIVNHPKNPHLNLEAMKKIRFYAHAIQFEYEGKKVSIIVSNN